MPSRDALFDRRILARNLKAGKITRKELEQYLTGLPDASARAMPMFGDRDAGPKEHATKPAEHGKS